MQVLRKVPFEQIFVLDIETVPCVGCHDELNEMLRLLWEHKCHALRREKGWNSSRLDVEPLPDFLHAATLFEQAGIYAEFGKVICISLGCFYFDRQEEQMRFRVKSFADHDEKQMLSEFAHVLDRKPQHILCAHNGKEFDFPYLSRRMLINGLTLPPQLDIAGKKPWEIPHLDTMELWKFGDRKSFTSLPLLAAMFNIPTPKDDINGSDVARVYYNEQDLPRIVKYCQKDIITTARLLQRFRGEEPFSDEAVVYADEWNAVMRKL
ncbi:MULTISPECIES: 3'-5' exonuclease [Hymenobacter]|uniref:3'-5' exonuclease n=1 Tax=Hymenobacter jejuensis TaxID=2502781 RepID=A0A5B7ZX76_9BACT|nr:MULTISPECIES: 3'-5' exonuclease [Hymenobacter]MBC6988042.1 3'-5' exonuclease [Hymenobacter sp. BT491]QDA59580.1 3'-5' exonuclease [Hymenobacter jejuensis]